MPSLSAGLRTKLSVMMFLQYAFQGAWVIPLTAYLLKSGYTGAEIGKAFSAIAIGFIVSPFFVGMVADRFFSAQKVLGVINIIAAGLLFAASQVVVDANGDPQSNVFFWVLLAHCLFYTPTWALTNTIALNQMTNPGKQFPSIRVMGTFGWIAISVISLYSAEVTAFFGQEGNIEKTNLPMMIGSGIGLVAGLLSFFMPNTPPKGAGEKLTAGDIFGVKALVLFKDRNFLVFAIASFTVVVIGIFYWVFGNGHLNEVGMKAVQFKQSYGQMMEVLFLVAMPFFFARFGVKKMLLVGMIAWLLRFVCFGFGDGAGMIVFLYGGIILHGICFDFFFVTGQLYTDKKAPKAVQAGAQGLITLITFGLGWYVGTEVAGRTLDANLSIAFQPADILIEAKYTKEEKNEKDELMDVEMKGLYGQIIDDSATSATSVGARLMASLTSGTAASIQKAATDEKLGVTEKATLVDELNETLKKPNFYMASDFDMKNISGPTKTLLELAPKGIITEEQLKAAIDAEKTPAGITEKQLMELNRIAIETAYPEEIAQRRHNWRSIFYVPIGIGFCVVIFFLLFFNDNLLVTEEKKEGEE